MFATTYTLDFTLDETDERHACMNPDANRSCLLAPIRIIFIHLYIANVGNVGQRRQNGEKKKKM